jgi:large subunit ribosomal protein L1
MLLLILMSVWALIPRKANQMVRGIVTLPHGTGKTVRVLVLCTPEKEEEAKAAGADYVGLDDYITKIKSGWTDVDVIITMPTVMPKIGALGKILGPVVLCQTPKPEPLLWILEKPLMK